MKRELREQSNLALRKALWLSDDVRVGDRISVDASSLDVFHSRAEIINLVEAAAFHIRLYFDRSSFNGCPDDRLAAISSLSPNERSSFRSSLSLALALGLVQVLAPAASRAVRHRHAPSLNESGPRHRLDIVFDIIS